MSNVRASPVSEFAFGLIMMLAKKAPFCFRNQQEKKWQRFFPMLLRSKTVRIVGLGNIGKEVARLAKAFGMRVITTRRSAKRVTRYVDKVVHRERLPELFAESDFVVLTLPLTPETHKLIGERELRQ
jgi:phosphoglycerate dehydrogenase-like enzyme